MFPCQELFRHPDRFLGIALVGDVVSLKCLTRAVTGDLHDDRFGDSGPPEIANSRSPQIMEEEAGYTRADTR